jgi:hypothetical protein
MQPPEGRVNRLKKEHWALKFLLRSVDIGVGWSILENWTNVSLTSRNWVMHHKLFPHVG